MMLYDQLIKEAHKYGIHTKGLTYSQILYAYNKAKYKAYTEAVEKFQKSC
jgi:hypothetical protein